MGTPEALLGHLIPIYGPEVVHGKTGPAPSGAVLFGPFSYANKKKDEEKNKVGESGNACVRPERSSIKL